MSRRMFLSLLGFTLLLASLVFTPMLVLANPADPGNNYYPANEGGIEALASEPAEAEPISNPQLYAGMIHRPEPMLATVKFRSDKDGSFYYLVTDTATKPSTEILTSWTTIGPIKADQSIDLKITGMGFGPKYIHGVLEDDANNLSNIITFFIPANYYYWENFESYPVGSTNFNTGDLLLPFKFIHSVSSWANQKIIENSGSNDSRFLTMSSGSNYTSDAAMPLEIGFAQSDKLYAIEYLAQPMQQNARNGELRLHTGSGSHGTLTDALDLEFRNGKLESLIVNDSNNSNVQTLLDDYTSEQWYQIKILVDTEKKLYSVYVDGELKASDLDAIGDYTYLNLTSGFSSTIRFDNLEIYVVEVRPPKPQLQSAQTSIDGQNIRLTFDLDMASDPMADGFILEADGIAHTIKSADLAIDRKSIYLNLETAIKYDQEIKLRYAPGSVKSEDGGPLLTFSDFNVLNLTHRKYYFTLPEPITVNGITISLILDPSEPAVSGTPIEAKINFKGTVILGGKHFVEIFKDTPQYAQNNRIYDRNVKTGEDYDFNILMGKFYFSEDISDFGLHHSFQAQDFPVLTSAETKTDGTQIILTFDWNMANPAGSQNDFAVEVDDEANLVTSCLLGSGPNVIYLNLKDKIEHGQTVKVSYTPG
ncbi:MAG: hypothetical protein GX121_04610, partial [Ignavibacteria bacterium]|nr:hypothetical protein [Ignavibacteria bacterium]